MRILVGILAHQLHSEVLRRVHSLDWDEPEGFDILTCWGQDIRPGESTWGAVTRKYQYLQRVFLSGPWDALLTVEQDMLLPRDALLRLSQVLREGASIAYGLYVWRYEGWHLWSAHPQFREDDNGNFRFSSLSTLPEEARRVWGDCVLVEGLGLGCTLIDRHALTRIPFRGNQIKAACDSYFAIDAQREGLIQVCDTGVACGHMLGDGSAIWPDPEQPTLYRIDQEETHGE